MKPRRIFLVGPPGAGKSTLAQQWGRKLNVPHLDTDSEIERRSGKSIPTLFAEGEEAFRRWERAVVLDLLRERKEGIWALGGGTLTQAELREVLQKEGYILWIDPPWEWLFLRLQQKYATRPLLHQRPAAEWRQFIERRRPFYRIADLHWDPSRIPEALVCAWTARRLSLPADKSASNSKGQSAANDNATAPNTAPPPAPKNHSAAPPHAPNQR